MTRNELLRRAVHILIGLGAYLVPVIGVDAALALALIAIPANAWLLPRLPGLRNVIRPDGTGTRAIWAYPLACAALLVVFHDRPVIAQIGWLSLGVGDGVAPFLGLAVRGPCWPWRREKRVLVSVLAGGAAALACAIVAPWPIAIAAGCAGAVADGLPRPIEDNVAWPVSAAVAAWIASP